MSLSLEDALAETGGDLTAAMDLILQSLNDSITSTEESLNSLTDLQTAIDDGDQEAINSLTLSSFIYHHPLKQTEQIKSSLPSCFKVFIRPIPDIFSSSRRVF